jgi:hypothetical protein
VIACEFCHSEKDDNWIVCQDCQRWTLKRLSEIPKLHRVLDSDPWLKLPERVENERPMRSAAGGTPANLYVLALLDKRTDVRSVLRPWVEEIHERMNARTPAPSDVLGLCIRLMELMPWSASNLPAAADLVMEVRDQHAALERAVSGSRRPPKPVPCPVILPGEGSCEGVLKMGADGTVTCRHCGSVWSFDDWQRLGALLAP